MLLDTGQSSDTLFIGFINTDLLFVISIFKDFYIKYKFKNLYFNIDILGIYSLAALEITFID